MLDGLRVERAAPGCRTTPDHLAACHSRRSPPSPLPGRPLASPLQVLERKARALVQESMDMTELAQQRMMDAELLSGEGVVGHGWVGG